MTSPSKSEIAFALEPLSPLLADGLEDLLIEHWQEVEQHQDAMPLSVDWQKYLMLERAGIYRCVVARRGARLVGYAAYFVQPPLHHRQKTWAVNDVLYLDPTHRRGNTGKRLIEAAESLMRDAGAKLITQEDRKQPTNSTSGKTSATLGDLLSRMGYFLAGRVYAKLL
jgi:GNAT superfamily N-acetyltransferase